ncbi:MAG: hypothetical protein LBF15_03590 [Candidatus Peribacteria bacterium]|jgi:hypothetical protein|nr:hypothetical protein [Candidatus Peribacteria bacterium]
MKNTTACIKATNNSKAQNGNTNISPIPSHHKLIIHPRKDNTLISTIQAKILPKSLRANDSIFTASEIKCSHPTNTFTNFSIH